MTSRWRVFLPVLATLAAGVVLGVVLLNGDDSKGAVATGPAPRLPRSTTGRRTDGSWIR